jgi:pimeloyl-ACP methyl ester carboxylesterase
MRRLSYLLITSVILSCGNKRTQEPREPISYQSDEVDFKSKKGDITLSGTLTTPNGETVQKAVILISGSGPQDRDYTNQFEHRPFLVLSDYLTQRGIAVLRYDERGVGKSEGDYGKATYEDLVSDAAGGISFLRQRGFKKVGIIGHSEGGGIATSTSQKVQVDFIVSMAGVSSTADKVLLYNTKYRLHKMDIDENVQQEIIGTVDSLLRILKEEDNTNTARIKMMEFISQRESKVSQQCKEVSEKLGDSRKLIEGWLDSKFIYSLHNDPLETLKKVRVPVLVLFGDDDGTIDLDRMLPEIKNALDSTRHEVKIFDDLGHLFMKSKGVPMYKLKEVEETIAPEVLESIYNWINHL